MYFASGKLALQVASINASASPAWPPTGIAIATFLLLGHRLWPAVLVGAFWVNITTQGTFLTSLGIAIGNTAEGLLGAFLVHRFAGSVDALLVPKTVVRFAVLAGLVAPIASATMGVASLALGGLVPPSQYAAVWLTWWLGDVSGALIVAPLILAWARLLRRGPVAWTRSRTYLYEAAALIASTAAVSYVVFYGGLPETWGPAPFLVLVLPIVAWAAFRFEAVGAATLTCALAGAAVLATLDGRGPFRAGSPNESILLLQAFMGTVAITSLVIAAVVRDRRVSHEGLRRSHDELEARVQARTRQLQGALEDLRSFTFAVSHDLRTPVAVINGYARLLSERPETEVLGEARSDVRTVLEEANRLSKLLEALLRLSRITHAQIDFAPVDLSALAQKVASGLQAREPEREATFDIEPGLQANGDPALLRLLLENLLGNAWKFTARRPQAVIRFRAHRDPAGPAFVVEDNGIGFRSEDVPKLFQVFSRLHPEADYPGTGIGLATARRIVERHGGTLWAKPGTPEGASFFFTLEPRAPA